MPNVPLSEETRRRLEALFPEPSREAATKLLVEQCGDNLPTCELSGPRELERIRFAELKLSHGDPAELEQAVLLAQIDWRDVLMAAGFGHDVRAHESWWPDGLGRR
jgi:hypothetical protein